MGPLVCTFFSINCISVDPCSSNPRCSRVNWQWGIHTLGRATSVICGFSVAQVVSVLPPHCSRVNCTFFTIKRLINRYSLSVDFITFFFFLALYHFTFFTTNTTVLPTVLGTKLSQAYSRKSENLSVSFVHSLNQQLMSIS